MKKSLDDIRQVVPIENLERIEWLRYALNTAATIPIISNWKGLYDFANKQKILGICEPSRYNIKIERDVLIRWIAVTQQIKNRSYFLNQRTTELYQMLGKAGFRCCILKGQGNAEMYPDPLMRMPGDIDVWIDADEQSICNYVKSVFPDAEESFKHIKFPVFPDVPVDIHQTPLKFRHPILQRRLQRWIAVNKEEQFRHIVRLTGTELDIVVPTMRFNAVYQLGHILTHLFDEGVGLRHLVDYFYVLKNLEGITDSEKKQIKSDWKYLGLSRLASAIMWIENEILGLPEHLQLEIPNEHLGRKILNDVLEGGNFGKYSQRQKNVGRGRINKRTATLRRLLGLYPYFPGETVFRLLARTSLVIKTDWKNLI